MSIFSVISKIVKKILCKFQCGFRKGCDTQDCLLAMLEHCKSEFDKRRVFGDTSHWPKVFDSLPYELIIAKLNA